MNTDEPWTVTGDLDPQKEAKEEADWELANRIREFAAGEIHRARSISTSWRHWASYLADAVARMPTGKPSAPRYMDEIGVISDPIDLSAGHVDPDQLRGLLHRVIADADAAAAAWQRAAEQVEQRQRNTLDIVRVHPDIQERVP